MVKGSVEVSGACILYVKHTGVLVLRMLSPRYSQEAGGHPMHILEARHPH